MSGDELKVEDNRGRHEADPESEKESIPLLEAVIETLYSFRGENILAEPCISLVLVSCM